MNGVNPLNGVRDLTIEEVDPSWTAMSQVSAFYKDKAVFVTGATGFMGKVLVEKLLFGCPEIGTIYLLMRPRRNVSVETRLQQFLDNPIFSRVSSDVLKKVKGVEGDINADNMGMSDDDKTVLQKEVSVVFHSAATVRFIEPLKKALDINLMGTKRVVDLARGMRNLVVFLHVSTCYAHCDRQLIEEVIYPNPRDIKSSYFLKVMDWMDEEMLETIKPSLVAGRPNTYTLTKAITETYLQEQCQDLPAIGIVRPSIVTASWMEPKPGWVDSLNGVTGAYMAAYVGLLKAVKIDRSVTSDFVPVDLVINLMIVAAWKMAKEGESLKQNNDRVAPLRIYNCASNGPNPLSWATIEDVGRGVGMRYPSISTIRYPQYTTYDPKMSPFSLMYIIYLLDIFFRHTIPAYAVDFIMKVLGYKPLMRDYLNRALFGADILHYFSINQWKFDTTNVSTLYLSLPKADQKLFNFDINCVKWPIAVKNHILGMRKYLMKEDDSNLIEARAWLRKLRYVDLAIECVTWASITFASFFMVNWYLGYSW